MTRRENDRIEEAAREAARAAAEDAEYEEVYGDADRHLDDDNTNVYHTENTTNNTKKGNGVTGFVCGALAVVVLAGGWQLIKKSKTGDVKTVPTSVPEHTDTVIEEPVPGEPAYDYNENEVVVTAEPEVTVAPVVTAEPVVTPEPVVEAATTEVELTTENFENLVADYANKYSNEYSAVSTEDITKFAVVGNIDLLAEENPELIREIAGNKTREEFLNDGAKLIGATVMNNFNVWNSTHSTENFVRVSDVIYGSQKNQMLKIEEYVDRIADAANADDKDLVNEIVSQFLVDMNSGDLSKLDDGVGFVAQVNIAMISDGIARNYLNKENFDMLQVLKTSEKYVSNIFTVYERCMGDVKTRTR